jgi:hypothetical protein
MLEMTRAITAPLHVKDKQGKKELKKPHYSITASLGH